MFQAFWAFSTMSNSSQDCNTTNKKNRCIQTIRQELMDRIPHVLTDIVINHAFAQYTLYGLCNSKSNAYLSSESIALQSFLNNISQPPMYSYQTIPCLNSSDIRIINNYIFAKDENNNLHSSYQSIHHEHLSYIQIKQDPAYDFIICGKRNNTEYDQPSTYLYDNNSSSFYSYNHSQQSLTKLRSKTFTSPPSKIIQVVRNINNHNFVYYWCLMSNGIIFKIVLDHKFFNTNHQQSSHSVFRKKGFISEHGPFEYHQEVNCGRHTLDLEVFRLIPEVIPKFKFMVSGGRHILFIDNHNKLWCYGENKYGQCGIKKSIDIIVQPIKNQLFKDVGIKKMFAGPKRSIVIDENGKCYIFGDGVEVTMRKPYKLLQSFLGMKDKRIVNGGCGNDHFIFVDDEGIVYGLGSNRRGQISTDLSVTKYDTPIIIDREYIGIASPKDERIERVIVNENRNYFLTSRNVKK